MITLIQLQYFVAVAETRSFTEASKQQFVSQQTLSIHIAQLEKEVGAPLFHRTRPLTITPAGERLLEGAREILHTKQIMLKDMKDLVAPEHGLLRIGVSHAHAHLFVPDILDDFFRQCPNADLRVRELTFEEMADALKERRIDVAIARPPFSYGSVKYVSLSEGDDLYLYAPIKGLKRFYGDRVESIRRQLREKPSLSIVKDAPFIITLVGTMREVLLKQMMKENIVPNVKIETTSLETAITLTMRGYGISAGAGRLLFPRVMTGTSRDPVDYGCYLIQRDLAGYALSLCYLANVKLTPLMQAFIRSTKRYFEEKGFVKDE